MSSRVIEAKKERILKSAQTLAEKLNFEVYDLKVVFKKKSSHVDVKIDSKESISHDNCSLFTKEFIQELDKLEVFENYSLEVSSPGLKRKIRNLDEYKRFVNEPVKLIYYVDENKTLSSKGVLIEVSENSIKVKEDGDRIIEIELNKIKRANLDY